MPGTAVFHSEISVSSTPPTLHLIVVENCARKLDANCDGLCRSTRAQINHGQVVAHLVCIIANILSVVDVRDETPAPALHLIGVQNGAHLLVAGGDVLRRKAGAEVDRGKIIAHLVRTIAAPVRVTLSELADIIFAPALHGRVIEQRAREVLAGGHLGGCSSRAKVNCG